MIKYSEGELLNTLTSPIADDVNTQALSYALKMGVGKLIGYAMACKMYADVDAQPEFVLDYMAVELDVVYYDTELPIKTKRELIKNSLKWHMKAGTRGAVLEAARAAFGECDIEEWYEFFDGPGTPGYFDIETEVQQTPETFNTFQKVIERVKGVSSWLRSIKTVRTVRKTEYEGIAIRQGGYTVIGSP